MSCATKVSQAAYAAVKWFPKPVSVAATATTTVKNGGTRSRKRKGKSMRQSSRRKQAGGSQIILENYIPDTLGVSAAAFEAAWPTAKRLAILGYGKFSKVYKYKITGHDVTCKFINSCIPVLNTNINTGRMYLSKLINNEVAALSELTRHADARQYIPQFVGLIKKLHTYYGGQLRSKISTLRITAKPDEYEYIIISSYINGSTLGNLYAERPTMFTPKFLEQLRADFGKALTAIHTAGWMHRDIHPQNLYVELDEAGSYVRPLLIDFGTAAQIGERVDAIGADKYQSERAKRSTEGYSPEFDFDSLDISLRYLKPLPIIPVIRTPSPDAYVNENNINNIQPVRKMAHLNLKESSHKNA
jgi:serine/threonine protein kinase